MIIKVLTDLRRMDEHRENFNNKKIQKEITELKNTVTKLKNTLDGFNCKLDEAEERTSDLEERTVELTQTKQQKQKRILKSEGSLRNL